MIQRSAVRLKRIDTFTNDDVGLVRAETHDGIVGFGQFMPQDPDIIATVFHRHVAEHAFHRDITDSELLNTDIIAANRRVNEGFVARALAGLDTAIWDIIGKAEEKPVWEIAGGASSTVTPYAASMRQTIEPEEEAQRLREICDEQGFNAVKLKIGKADATRTDEDEWPGRTEELISTTRNVLGDDIDIYVDANSAFTVERAVEVGQEILAPHDVAMFEEPCPYWDIEGTAEVTERTDVPVAVGEFLHRPEDWDQLINRPTVDIVQPDICFSVGFTRALNIAQRAETNGLTIRPHTGFHTMNLVFTSHLVSAIGATGAEIEYPIDNDWVAPRWGRSIGWDTEFYEPNLSVTDGNVGVPSRPGWGLSVDPEWLAEARQRQSTPD